MDDLKILHDAWGTPTPPSPAASAQARAALLARSHARPLPRLSTRVAAAAALLLAIAAGVAVVENLGGTGGDGVPVANAAQVLERAAVAAEKKPFAAPRDDQWIYVEDRFTRSQGGTETHRSWRRADGRGQAWIDERGKLRFRPLEPLERHPRKERPRPLEGYKALAALPTDADDLLHWAYAQPAENGDDSRHAVVYLLFNHIRRENLLPPALDAAIFRAMKEIPGVTVDTVNVFGRPALALSHTGDWLRQELLLDPETYAYRGQRSTVTKDATIDPLKAGNATGSVKKGSTVVVERVTTAIVDEPGERPRRSSSEFGSSAFMSAR
jgi:hypothetical protein